MDHMDSLISSSSSLSTNPTSSPSLSGLMPRISEMVNGSSVIFNETSPTAEAVINQQPQQRHYKSYEELELLDKNWQRMIIMLYTLTALLAFLGNILAICVLIFGKRSSKELRIFLVNLSMSDILMAVFSIPFTYMDFMLGRWIFAPAFCPIVQQMQTTCVFVSVYTLTAIGIDRYMAIIHPLFSQRYNRSFGPIVITIIWIFGFMLGFVQYANTEATPFLIANETNYDCKEINSDQSQFFTIIILIITFALPMSILSFTYFSIGMKIFRHSTPGNADVARDRAQQSSKVKIMKMLVTIVILFAVCWLPLHILNLFIYFARDLMVNVYNSQLGFTIYVTIAFTAHWFSMANSFVNPIIYCFMSENFRADLRDLFPQCLKRMNLMPSPKSMSMESTTMVTNVDATLAATNHHLQIQVRERNHRFQKKFRRCHTIAKSTSIVQQQQQQQNTKTMTTMTTPNKNGQINFKTTSFYYSKNDDGLLSPGDSGRIILPDPPTPHPIQQQKLMNGKRSCVQDSMSLKLSTPVNSSKSFLIRYILPDKNNRHKSTSNMENVCQSSSSLSSTTTAIDANNTATMVAQQVVMDYVDDDLSTSSSISNNDTIEKDFISSCKNSSSVHKKLSTTNSNHHHNITTNDQPWIQENGEDWNDTNINNDNTNENTEDEDEDRREQQIVHIQLSPIPIETEQPTTRTRMKTHRQSSSSLIKSSFTSKRRPWNTFLWRKKSSKSNNK